MVKTARRAAKKYGIINLSKKNLCKELGIPPGSFEHFAKKSFSEIILEIGDFAERPRVKYRVFAALRKKHIIQALIATAKRIPYNTMTRKDIAKTANVSPALISHYLGDMSMIRKFVVKISIRDNITLKDI